MGSDGSSESDPIYFSDDKSLPDENYMKYLVLFGKYHEWRVSKGLEEHGDGLRKFLDRASAWSESRSSFKTREDSEDCCDIYKDFVSKNIEDAKKSFEFRDAEDNEVSILKYMAKKGSKEKCTVQPGSKLKKVRWQEKMKAVDGTVLGQRKMEFFGRLKDGFAKEMEGMQSENNLRTKQRNCIYRGSGSSNKKHQLEEHLTIDPWTDARDVLGDESSARTWTKFRSVDKSGRLGAVGYLWTDLERKRKSEQEKESMKKKPKRGNLSIREPHHSSDA